VEDLIASTDRGLLVTRFWYIRTVNPQTLQLTGLTRDGVWLVEKGKVAGPVNNFRFNESPANMLKNAEAMSAPVSTGTMVVPAIKAKDFNFSSKSDAI
jgi:predicted Zn-dependent protease